MDRTENMTIKLASFREKWLIKKVTNYRKEDNSSLLEAVKTLLTDIDEKKYKNCYISLCCYNSSLLSGTFRYKIFVSDEGLYLDSLKKCADWIPEFLFNDVNELKISVENELKKNFVRIKFYEIEYVVSDILKEYHKITEVIWSNVAKEICDMAEFQRFPKKKCKFLYLYYLDQIKPVLQP